MYWRGDFHQTCSVLEECVFQRLKNQNISRLCRWPPNRPDCVVYVGIFKKSNLGLLPLLLRQLRRPLRRGRWLPLSWRLPLRLVVPGNSGWRRRVVVGFAEMSPIGLSVRASTGELSRRGCVIPAGRLRLSVAVDAVELFAVVAVVVMTSVSRIRPVR